MRGVGGWTVREAEGERGGWTVKEAVGERGRWMVREIVGERGGWTVREAVGERGGGSVERMGREKTWKERWKRVEIPLYHSQPAGDSKHA